MKLKDNVVEFLVQSKNRFKDRGFMLDLLTVVDNRPELSISPETIKRISNVTTTTEEITITESGVYSAGDMVVFAYPTAKGTVVGKLCTQSERPMDVIDVMPLKSGMIANYNGKPTTTTFGVFFVNQLLLAEPFGRIIPYVQTYKELNKLYSSGMGELVLDGTISIESLKRHYDYLSSMAGFGEIVVPTITAKSLTTSPAVEKYMQDAINKYGDKLNDPKIASAVEDGALALDAEHLKGDSSNRFFDPLGSKAKKVARKKLHITVGSIEEFDQVSGKHKFIGTPYSKGWKVEDFPTLVNDTTKASYNRGKQTALGGMMSKYILRVFMGVQITVDDCGDKQGFEFTLTEDDVKVYMNRTLVVGNRQIELNEQNVKQFIGKTVRLRSPMSCKAVDGFCYTCMGKHLKVAGVKDVGMEIVKISSTIQDISMKAMHGTALSLLDIGDTFSDFLID